MGWLKFRSIPFDIDYAGHFIACTIIFVYMPEALDQTFYSQSMSRVTAYFFKFEARVQLNLRGSFEHLLRDLEFQWERRSFFEDK